MADMLLRARFDDEDVMAFVNEEVFESARVAAREGSTLALN